MATFDDYIYAFHFMHAGHPDRVRLSGYGRQQPCGLHVSARRQLPYEPAWAKAGIMSYTCLPNAVFN